MSKIDINILLGGPQGGGIDTSSTMVSRAFAYAGYPVLSTREYHSNIKGRHSYMHLRVKEVKPRSLKYPVDVLTALDPDTVFEHLINVGKGTRVIYDSSFEGSELDRSRMIMRDTVRRIRETLQKESLPENVKGMITLMERRGATSIAIPFSEIILDAVPEGPATRYFNTFGAAITLAILGVDLKYTEEAIKAAFSTKKHVIEPNLKVASAAYEYCESKKLRVTNLPRNGEPPKLMLTGNDAAAIGKVMGGLRFQSYYPITPASDESTVLEEHDSLHLLENEKNTLEKEGVTVIQTEDEIAAIAMASGASLTGAVTSTATSGPGFALMAEAISFAGMVEIPVVITLYQRGGPSTGLPTRNQQADLLFALNTGHGEFPRVVISSGDVEDCIYDSIRAINYAQRYQVPVIHLIDKYLANTVEVLNEIDTKRVKIVKPLISEEGGIIKRYTTDTNNGISPIGYFGKNIFWMTGDEHDELGHVTEDSVMREKQMEKRMRKEETIEAEIPVRDRVELFGDENAPVTIVTWGSQKGVVLDVIDDLREEGISAKMLFLKMFEPFPVDFVYTALKKSKTVIAVESNMVSQAAMVIEQRTSFKIENNILKYNGRHITEEELLDAVKKILSGAEKKVVLRNGA